MEHAIIHILRHRRQVEKFIRQGLISARPVLDVPGRSKDSV